MVVTTGFFDGVHLGHRRVIETLVAAARERGSQSCVVTFWPHPRTVLQNGARELRLLSSFQEKKQMLLSLGVDRIEVIDFNKDFSVLTTEQYFNDYIIGKYAADAVVVGYDNRMGSDGLSLEGITAVAESKGIDVIPVSDCHSEGTGLPVSSTSIRIALGIGDVSSAALMLGYNYSLSGVVVPGERIGRTIGFPTANIALNDPLKLIPAQGAYLVSVEVCEKTFYGMCNVGRKLEVNIFDFSGQIYGSNVKIFFLRKIRNEIEFNSVSLLKEQLERDKICCEEWISEMLLY